MSTPPPLLTDELKAGNSLGLIRLVLSTLVIVGHGYELGGFGKDPLFGLTGVTMSTLAVIGFFCISGYLITGSAVRTSVVPYLWRRFLRIFPGYLVVLLVSALLVGPFAWAWARGTLDGYFTTEPGGPWTYLLANADLDVAQHGIHGVFTTTPYGQDTGASVVNGSLWTLIHEWRCYLLVAALAVLGVLRRNRWLVLVLTAVMQTLLVLRVTGTGWSDVVLGAVPGWEGDNGQWAVIRFTTAFLFGACLALFADRVPHDDRIGLACVAVFLVGLLTGGVLLLSVPAAAYALLWGSTRLPLGTRAVGATNDYSYGVYVYGFVIQQLLAGADVHLLGVAVYVVAAVVVTAPCAYLSWHLVEKQALRLKTWGPGSWQLGAAGGSRATRSTVGEVVEQGPMHPEVEAEDRVDPSANEGSTSLSSVDRQG